MKLGQTGRRQRPGRPSHPAAGRRSALSGVIAATLLILTLSLAALLAIRERTLVSVVMPSTTATVVLSTAIPSSPAVTKLPTPPSTSLPSLQPSASVSPLATPSSATLPTAPPVFRLSPTSAPLRYRSTGYPGSYPPPQPTSPPAPPPSRPPVVRCRRPAGWVDYIVQWGDTLSGLAARYGTTVQRLKDANCLPSYTIYAGSRLWVPYRLPTPVPWRGRTATPSRTATPIRSVTATATPPGTLTPTPSATSGPTGTTIPPTEPPPPPTEPPPPPTEPPPPPTEPLPPPTELPPTEMPAPAARPSSLVTARQASSPTYSYLVVIGQVARWSLAVRDFLTGRRLLDNVSSRDNGKEME